MKLADTKKIHVSTYTSIVMFILFASDVNALLNIFKIPQKEAVVKSSTYEVTVKALILTAQH